MSLLIRLNKSTQIHTQESKNENILCKNSSVDVELLKALGAIAKFFFKKYYR